MASDGVFNEWTASIQQKSEAEYCQMQGRRLGRRGLTKAERTIEMKRTTTALAERSRQ